MFVQYQMDPRQELVDGCRSGCYDCAPGWTDLDLGVCAWPSPESSYVTYVTYVTCLISPRCCHAHVMTKSALVCADPDTPCVPCEANTYAPMPGTRGQCPLCSEVANSGTIRDADVRVAPSPASCYASFLLRLRAASVRSDAYAWTVVWLCSTTHPLHART